MFVDCGCSPGGHNLLLRCGCLFRVPGLKATLDLAEMNRSVAVPLNTARAGLAAYRRCLRTIRVSRTRLENRVGSMARVC